MSLVSRSPISLAALALVIAQAAQAQTPATPQSAPAQPAPAQPAAAQQAPAQPAPAQQAPPAVVAGIPVNYDESKVGTYTLPDPLVTTKGVRVRDALTWRRIRRPEILGMIESTAVRPCAGQAGQGDRGPVRHGYRGARRESDSPADDTVLHRRPQRSEGRAAVVRARRREGARADPAPDQLLSQRQRRRRSGDQARRDVEPREEARTGAAGERLRPRGRASLPRERHRLRDVVLRRHRARLHWRHPVRHSWALPQARAVAIRPGRMGRDRRVGVGAAARDGPPGDRARRSTRSASRSSARRGSGRPCSGRARPTSAMP